MTVIGALGVKAHLVVTSDGFPFAEVYLQTYLPCVGVCANSSGSNEIELLLVFMFCLYVLMLYIPVNNFLSCRDDFLTVPGG